MIEAYVLSNIGNIRDNHEDNFFIPKKSYIDEKKQKEIKTNDNLIDYEYTGENGIFVVCDGMGGHNAGEVASRLAVESVYKIYDDLLSHDKEYLVNYIKELNNFVCDYSENNPDCADMGTTFSGLFFIDKKIHMLHVGDSRIYQYKKNELKQISKDHTEGCRLVEAGVLKEEDLSKFPNRKSLYKYLGRKGELIADCETIEFENATRFIISSDGLSDTLTHEEIEKEIITCSTAKDVCKNLVKRCLEKGKICSDNVTVICIDIK